MFAVQEESLEIYYRWYFSIPRQLYINSLIVFLVYIYILCIFLFYWILLRLINYCRYTLPRLLKSLDIGASAMQLATLTRDYQSVNKDLRLLLAAAKCCKIIQGAGKSEVSMLSWRLLQIDIDLFYYYGLFYIRLPRDFIYHVFILRPIGEYMYRDKEAVTYSGNCRRRSFISRCNGRTFPHLDLAREIII